MAAKQTTKEMPIIILVFDRLKKVFESWYLLDGEFEHSIFSPLKSREQIVEKNITYWFYFSYFQIRCYGSNTF